MAFVQNAINNLLATTSLTGQLTLAQLPSIGSDTVLANVTGGSAVPTAATVTSIIDTIGSTQGDILYRGASSWTVLAPGTNGQFLTTGGASANPSWSTGSSAFTPIPQTVVSGTSQAASVNNGYITNNAALCTVTLPSTASVGQLVQITGQGAGGWKLAQNSGQSIIFNSNVTTTGTGGSLSSSLTNDSITVMCTVTNTTWIVTDSQGNISGV